MEAVIERYNAISGRFQQRQYTGEIEFEPFLDHLIFVSHIIEKEDEANAGESPLLLHAYHDFLTVDLATYVVQNPQHLHKISLMRWCYLVYPVYKTIKGLQNAGII